MPTHLSAHESRATAKMHMRSVTGRGGAAGIAPESPAMGAQQAAASNAAYQRSGPHLLQILLRRAAAKTRPSGHGHAIGRALAAIAGGCGLP